MKEGEIPKSDEGWKKRLDEETYRVTREKGTEAPFTGKYLHNKKTGMYACSNCGSTLFSSDAKFDSGTGWPSFTEPANLEHVELVEDNSYGMRRTEVVCKRCGAHLGHMFEDGPRERGGKRFCINSCSLDFKEGERT